MSRKTIHMIIFAGFFSGFLLTTSIAQAQYRTTLEDRVQALENYVDTFEPTLRNFSDEFERSIREYTLNLENSLKDYSRNLEEVVEDRLFKNEKSRAILDSSRGSFQQVITKAGNFLIAVKDIRKTGDGVRLTLDVGNPNFANYRDFTLKLIWGSRQPMTNDRIAYQEWRKTLYGTEYAFQGLLERGKWNEVQIDLVSSSSINIEYLEVEMQVESVELESKNN